MRAGMGNEEGGRGEALVGARGMWVGGGGAARDMGLWRPMAAK